MEQWQDTKYKAAKERFERIVWQKEDKYVQQM